MYNILLLGHIFLKGDTLKYYNSFSIIGYNVFFFPKELYNQNGFDFNLLIRKIIKDWNIDIIAEFNQKNLLNLLKPDDYLSDNKNDTFFNINDNKNENYLEFICEINNEIKNIIKDNKEITKPKKVSIVLTYYNRLDLLKNTLKSIEDTKFDKNEIEVICYDDCSIKEPLIIDISNYSFTIKLIYGSIDKDNNIINSSFSFNKAFQYMTGEYIIIQNAECLHIGDIISYTVENVKKDNFISFPCWGSESLDINNKIFENRYNKNTLKDILDNKWHNLDHPKEFKGWFNEKNIRPECLHFCNAFHRTTFNKVGLFDIRYDKVLGFDDINYAKRWMFHHNLDVLIPDHNYEILVIHQYHGKNAHYSHEKYLSSKEIHEKIESSIKNNFKLNNNEKIVNFNYSEINTENFINNIYSKYSFYLINVNVDKYLTNIDFNFLESLLNFSNIRINNTLYLQNQKIHYIKEKHKSISIVMTYYNRKPQTLETLKGFERMYANNYNFEVVIVDDNSNDENRLEEDIKQFSFPINLIVITKEEKGDRINPCLAYNKGFKEASGDIIIIQNPECYHVGDILKHTIENLNEQDYFTYSCFTANSAEITNQIINSKSPLCLINNENFLNKNFYAMDNHNLNWYNHPYKVEDGNGSRCTNYHFCSAIYKCNLDLIGGFTEKFKYGFCYDDNELLHRIKHNLKLNIKCIDPNNCLVIHQWHPKTLVNFEENNLLKFKWKYNNTLMNIFHNSKNFNYPKIFHTYWDGSSMSYLTYLTYVSFLKYHPDWSVVVHIPKQRYEKITWVTPEQKDKYTGTDYFNKMLNNHCIIKNYVDFEKIGFYNNVSEVIKSDYLRYYMLYKYGGVWSDNDIIYTASIENKLNYNNENILFKCSWTKGSFYYPIGFFCCKRNSAFFEFLIKKSKQYYNKDYYQSIGATMINNLIEKNEIDISNSIFLDNTYYLPFHFNQLDKIFKLENSNVHNNTFGVHWFNGSKESKIYQNTLSERIHNFKITCFIDKLINEYIKNIEYLANYFTNYYTIPDKINEIKYSNQWLLEKIPKRLFVYWGGEKLPWLRYMTIESFIQFNPEWEIIFIIPKTLSNILTWNGKQPERFSLDYKDYMPNIYELEKKNILKVEIFDFETIGLDNNYNEVHKSDFLRYYLLFSRGGVWSDMDVLYYKSINYISVNNLENKDKEVFVKYKDINSKEIGIDGHAIGFLMGAQNNLFFKELFNLAKIKYNPNGYQIIGPDLLNENYPVDDELKNEYNLECITKEDIYSLDHNTPSLFQNFEDNDFDNYYVKKSFGIHWYGGHLDFKSVLMEINDDNFKNYPNNGFVLKKLRQIKRLQNEKKKYVSDIYTINQNICNNDIISLVIISTNLKRRFNSLVNTINSFKPFYKNIIDEIVLSVDKLENYGETMSEKEIVEYMTENKILEENQIHFKKGEGMLSNQCNGIGISNGNIIIYSEDDIVIKKLPSRENIIKLTDKSVICYNKDLLYPYDENGNLVKLYEYKNIYNKKNFINLGEDYFYKKDKTKYSRELSSYASGLNLSVTFPCAIMKRNIFTKVYNDISKIDYNFHIESAFSHVINSLSYDSYIFCINDKIPLDVPWLYRDNCSELEVAGETIDRTKSSLKLLNNNDIDRYNIRNKDFYIKLFTKLISSKIPFSFSKYGDGEYFASKGVNGANCDNDNYTDLLSNSINKAFKNIKKNKFYGLWHDFNNVSSILSEKKVYWEEKVDVIVNWVDYHIFIYTWSDINYDYNNNRNILYKTIKESKLKKIYVCNRLLVKSKDLLNIDKLIHVPFNNFFDTEYNNIKRQILNEINDDMCIIMFSTGMSAKVFISDLSDLKPNNIYLDIGSALDEICTKFNSRGMRYNYPDLMDSFSKMIPESWEDEKFDNIILDARKNTGSHLVKDLNYCFIVTSVININPSELLFAKRSLYSCEERFKQTLEGLKSIRNKMPHSYIILAEGSDLDPIYSRELCKYLDKYINTFSDENITKDVNSKLKGYGETTQLLNVLNKINFENMDFDKVFKISGRYSLNNNYNINNFNGENLIICNKYIPFRGDDQHPNTVLFCINKNYISNFKNSLERMKKDYIKYENSEEYKNKDITGIPFFEKIIVEYNNVTLIPLAGVCGWISSYNMFFES